MSLAEANLSLPDNFTGVVKVFPLPNLVLFPGVIQPLHIFEPRYRKMMEDALAGDELISIAMLRPNWETLATDRPPVHSTICVGKIVTHTKLDDGRFNLLLLGAKRARILRELPAELPYRLAEVELIEDPVENDPEFYRGPIRKHVVQLFRQLVDQENQLDCESVEHLLHDDLPFGLLLDLITFSSGAELAIQQKVLDTVDILKRADTVIEVIEQRLEQISLELPDPFPPVFSMN